MKRRGQGVHQLTALLVLAIIGFAGINYAASTWNRKVDLSYFKTSRVGSDVVFSLDCSFQARQRLSVELVNRRLGIKGIDLRRAA